MVSRALVAGLLLAVFSIGSAHAANYPSAQCVLNGNRSHLTMVAQNTDDKRYACTATCQYKVTSQRPLYTFDCNFSLAAHAAEKVACDLTGAGPDHFADVQPTKYVCEPR